MMINLTLERIRKTHNYKYADLFSSLLCFLESLSMGDRGLLLMQKQEEEEEEDSMYGFYKRIESQTRVRKGYLKDKLRAILVDWLTEVHTSMCYAQATLFLAVNIADRFLSLEVVLWAQFKLVGMAALVIACKYEEEWFPSMTEFNKIPESYFTCLFHGLSYSQAEINSMESKILNKLGWKIMVPTIHTFLLEFLRSFGDADRVFKNLSFYFGELAMNDYDINVRYSPSLIAASAVYAAQCCICKRHGWNRALKTGYSKRQVAYRAGSLLRLAKLKPDRKVFQKYSNCSTWDAVALVPLSNIHR
jgi:hypothetical protein